MLAQHTCPHCETIFFAKPSSNRIYCSKPCYGADVTAEAIALFLAKTIKTGTCWIAGNKPQKNGYTQVAGMQAHRLALEIAIGRSLASNELSCHTCDNRMCIRNDDIGIYVVRGVEYPRYGHLWLGTREANIYDAADKKRIASGDQNGSRTTPASLKRGTAHYLARFTENDIRQIRARYAKGEAHSNQIAAEYGVNGRTIRSIINRKNWKHVQ